MGIADVFFWMFITALALMCGAGTIGAAIFTGRISAEWLVFAVFTVVMFYLSYIFWPFQLAMKVVS